MSFSILLSIDLPMTYTVYHHRDHVFKALTDVNHANLSLYLKDIFVKLRIRTSQKEHYFRVVFTD